jgi:hypothetical protein
MMKDLEATMRAGLNMNQNVDMDPAAHAGEALFQKCMDGGDLSRLLTEVEPLLSVSKFRSQNPLFKGTTLLCAAAHGGNVNTTRLLLAARADPNVFINVPASNGSRPKYDDFMLMQAKLLVGGSYDVLCRFNNRSSALYEAARMGHTNLVRLLLDAGADVDDGDAAPIDVAVMNDDVDVLRMLIDAGGDLERQHIESGAGTLDYPTLRAIRNGKLKVIQYFQRHGLLDSDDREYAQNEAKRERAQPEGPYDTSAEVRQAIAKRAAKQCATCGKRTGKLKTCGHCKAVSYCGSACQRADWTSHKGVCKPPPPAGATSDDL